MHSDLDSNPEFRQLSEENARLRHAVEELAILNDLALAIGGSLDSDKIMRTIVSRSIRALKAEQGDITLVTEDDAAPSHTLVRSMVSSDRQSPLHLNQNLLGWMHNNKKPIRINDPKNDARFKYVRWDPSMSNLLSAPLLVRSKLIGIVTVYNKKEKTGFSESDQRLLAIIAAQSAQMVENARLYEEEQAMQVMRQELQLAADIQKKLLPLAMPQVSGYNVAGKSVAAQAVGGDYFDFIRLSETKLAVCLADISGKGLPASLLMSNLQAILRALSLDSQQPGEILQRANRQLHLSTSSEKFATIVFGILDTTRHLFSYSIGGHEHPVLLKKDGSLLRLQAGGLPLGLMDGPAYAEESVPLEPGDCLFMYSDGLTDCENNKKEHFGEERLLECMTDGYTRGLHADKILETVFERCAVHSGKENQFDDMTAVVLSRQVHDAS